jgi:hypothetical protein
MNLRNEKWMQVIKGPLLNKKQSEIHETMLNLWNIKAYNDPNNKKWSCYECYKEIDLEKKEHLKNVILKWGYDAFSTLMFCSKKCFEKYNNMLDSIDENGLASMDTPIESH